MQFFLYNNVICQRLWTTDQSLNDFRHLPSENCYYSES